MRLSFKSILPLLLASGLASASMQSSPIGLEGAKIAPGETGQVSFSNLSPDTKYMVKCKIGVSGIVIMNKLKDVQFDLHGSPLLPETRYPLSIDGKDAKYREMQQINASGSDIRIDHVDKSLNYFSVRNFDSKDTILVYVCAAFLE